MQDDISFYCIEKATAYYIRSNMKKWLFRDHSYIRDYILPMGLLLYSHISAVMRSDAAQIPLSIAGM